MPKYHVIPIQGTGIEIGDVVTLAGDKLEVVGRQGTIYDHSLGHQAYVSQGELAGIADPEEVLSGCIIIAYTCGDHDPPCKYDIVYQQID